MPASKMCTEGVTHSPSMGLLKQKQKPSLLLKDVVRKRKQQWCCPCQGSPVTAAHAGVWEMSVTMLKMSRRVRMETSTAFLQMAFLLMALSIYWLRAGLRALVRGTGDHGHQALVPRIIYSFYNKLFMEWSISTGLGAQSTITSQAVSRGK